jgi:hypothetical protein
LHLNAPYNRFKTLTYYTRYQPHKHIFIMHASSVLAVFAAIGFSAAQDSYAGQDAAAAAAAPPAYAISSEDAAATVPSYGSQSTEEAAATVPKYAISTETAAASAPVYPYYSHGSGYNATSTRQNASVTLTTSCTKSTGGNVPTATNSNGVPISTEEQSVVVPTYPVVS